MKQATTAFIFLFAGVFAFLVAAAPVRAATLQGGATMLDATHADFAGNNDISSTTWSGATCSGNTGNTAITAYTQYLGTYPDTSSPNGGGTLFDSWANGFSNVSVGSVTNWYNFEIKTITNSPSNCDSTAKDTVYVQFVCMAGVCDPVNPITDTTTRIITVTPADGSTFPTSSVPFAVGATGYVNADDFVSGMVLNALYTRVNQFNNEGLDDAEKKGGGQVSFPITSSGSFSFSTSSIPDPKTGAYEFRTIITKPLFSVLGINFFLNKTIAATTTVFAIGTTSPQDWTTLNFAQQQALGGSATNTLDANANSGIAADCQFLTFNIGRCVGYLFNPPSDQFGIKTSDFYQTVLIRAPLGYVTRMVNIFSSSTPAEPIALTYTFGSSSPSVLNGRTYTINIFDESYIGPGSPIYEAESDDGQNKNIWDIVDPYFTTVVAIAVFLVILSDVMGIELQHDATQIPSGGSRMSIIESARVGRSAKRSLDGKGPRTDNMGRTAEERRRVINRRGINHDASGGGGIIH